MIYTAKRDSENWIILDGENVTISKAKLQFKNHNAYGKIVITNNQYELLYNPLAFKNNRPRVNIFKGKKNENDAVYKSFKFDKKYGLYRYYQLRLDKHSYYCYLLKSNKENIKYYIYDHETLICVMESVSSKQYEVVDLYMLNEGHLSVALLFLLSIQIFNNQQSIGISKYAPAPLHPSDNQFIFHVKENYLKEHLSYD